MCRSIVSLRDVDDLTPDEVQAAARQFVRKVSGTKGKTPSLANEDAFDRAIAEITDATTRLLESWVVPPRPGPAPAIPASLLAARAARAAREAQLG